MIFGRYTVEEYKSFTEHSDVLLYLIREAPQLSKKFGSKIDWKNFCPFTYARNGRFMVARRDGEIKGIHLSRLIQSVFDQSLVLCFQDLLFAEPHTKAARLLLDDFIDFGKRNSNHILTVISEGTNIKEESILKLGFKKLETLYRMEV